MEWRRKEKREAPCVTGFPPSEQNKPPCEREPQTRSAFQYVRKGESGAAKPAKPPREGLL